QCLSAIGAVKLPSTCNMDNYCVGLWCTKGPNDNSNGILYSCANVAPIDTMLSECKYLTDSLDSHVNCYCNNMDFCNSAIDNSIHITVIIILLINYLFCYMNYL
uniref:Uncharacterized protein n=1 Tax=Parascaris univalens TaxID=6257 RepID=A0A915AZM3_PARUN